jgi:cell division protein FtsZ
MNEAGSAVMGIGHGSGENRAEAAADKAISSPLLETSMEGARGVLLSIAGPADMTLHEVNTAAKLIADHSDEDANIIFGAIVDEGLGDDMRVTVIAAGFDREPRRRRELTPLAPLGGDDDGEDEELDIPGFVQG